MVMIVSAAFSKWRASSICCGWCRVKSCLTVMFSRADTAPTEFSIAAFLGIYATWLFIMGPGHWDDAEYTHIARIMPIWCWLVWLVAMSTGQLISLLSSYPLSAWSRAYRLAITFLTTSTTLYMASIRVIERSTADPDHLFLWGLSCGGLWILLRTRGVRE